MSDTSERLAALAKEAEQYKVPSQPLQPLPQPSSGPNTYKLAEIILNVHTGLASDEHGANTPERFINLLAELTACRDANDDYVHRSACIKWAQFSDNTDEMIVMTNIPFVSVCNHHIVPFVGKAHIAYVPKGEICGLSKLVRVTQHFGRRLQVQERMTRQIAEFLEDRLLPLGVAVILQAEHMCMTIRGVQAPGTITTTSAMRGVFADHTRTAKAEFMQILGGAK